MDVKLSKITYTFQDNLNKCDVIIYPISETYEIYRRSIKDKDFIKKVTDFMKETGLINEDFKQIK